MRLRALAFVVGIVATSGFVVACRDKAMEPPATSAPASSASASTPGVESEPESKPVVAPTAPAPGPKSSPVPKKIAVRTTGHWACSTKEPRADSVSSAPEPRGARISIAGQGPCPGEIREWNAEVDSERVEVRGTYGAPARCKCVGSGDMVLSGLEPGTYDVHVNGAFDRPIAVRVTVPR